MIRVGDAVWFWMRRPQRPEAQPWPAIVAFVHSESRINVWLANGAGRQQNAPGNLPLLQKGDDVPHDANQPYCTARGYVHKFDEPKAEATE